MLPVDFQFESTIMEESHLGQKDFSVLLVLVGSE